MAPHAHVPAPRNTIETYSARPEREPPRNEKGEIICQHEACQGKTETFRRPCEWNKHMDKHERPYKCNEPTCEQNPGFTYSGGLLRHMREVHKKGVGPTRKPLYCPHANCIRSTGEGFTRRENLEEHLRRRHSYTGHYSPPPQSISSQNEDGQDQPRKRRKTAEPDSSLDGQQVQLDQNQIQHLTESRRDSQTLRTDPQLLAADRSHTNGNDADLDRAEAIRQLALARQTITDQQEIIRQQDYELQHLRLAVQNSAPGAPYSTRSSERSLTALADAPGALPVHLPQHELYEAVQAIADSQTNGNTHVSGPIAQALQASQGIQTLEQQARDEEGNLENGQDSSGRIETGRDSVAERQVAA